MGKKDNKDKDKDKIEKEPLNHYHKVRIIRSLNETKEITLRTSASNGSLSTINSNNNEFNYNLLSSNDNRDDDIMTEDILLKKPVVIKKKQNIPICDVSFDPQYDSLISDNYIIQNSYLRTNRRIDDENDVIIEYIADEDDLIWLKSLIARKQLNESTINNIFVFETVINLLERNTAYAKDSISFSSAEKLINAKLTSEQLSVISHIFVDIYNYWIMKRDVLQKSLCRKFWPQTPSNDTNPHHVFRARDKERYRLRKQHRRNDIESFRKMHHLRREFEKAQQLLNYVLEREKLNEADFEIQQEIFDQYLFDRNINTSNQSVDNFKDNNDNDNKTNEITSNRNVDIVNMDIAESKDNYNSTYSNINRRNEMTFRYTPTYLDISNTVIDTKTLNDLKYNKTLQYLLQSDKKNRILNDNDLNNNNSIRSNDETLSNLPDDLNGSIIDKLYNKRKKTNDFKFKKKRDKPNNQYQLYANQPKQIDELQELEKKQGTVVDINSNILQIPTAANITNINNYLTELNKTQTIPLDNNITIGKLGIWVDDQAPTFFHHLDMREQIPNSLSFTDYIKDLEFRDQTPIPNSYRCRGRIGRGGRLVIDRIPIYDRPTNLQYNNNKHIENDMSYTYSSTSNTKYLPSNYKYIQPTTITTQPKFTFNNPTNNTSTKKNYLNRSNGVSVIDGNIFYNNINSNMYNSNLGIGYSTQLPISIPLQSSSLSMSLNHAINSNNNVDSNNPANSNNTSSSSIQINDKPFNHHIHYCLPVTNQYHHNYKPLALIKRSYDIYNQSDSEDEAVDYNNNYLIHNVTNIADKTDNDNGGNKSIKYKLHL